MKSASISDIRGVKLIWKLFFCLGGCNAQATEARGHRPARGWFERISLGIGGRQKWSGFRQDLTRPPATSSTRRMQRSCKIPTRVLRAFQGP